MGRGRALVGFFQSYRIVVRCNGDGEILHHFDIAETPLMEEENRATMGQLLTICLCWSLSVAGTRAEVHANSRSIEVVQGKFTAFNQHDVDAIEGIYASDAMLNSPDYHNLSGNIPIADTYRKLFAAIPDARDDIELLEAVGNRVYVQFVLTGHWSGLQTKPFTARIFAVYTVVDGHIVEDATYYDRKTP